MSANKKHQTFYLAPDALEKLKRRAEQESKTFGIDVKQPDIIRKAIDLYLSTPLPVVKK